MGINSGFRSAFISGSFALCCLLNSSTAQSSQTVTLNDDSSNMLAQATLEPGEILNCFQVYFPSFDFYAIVQNVPENGAAYAEFMRSMAKFLATQVILVPGNVANDQYASGQTYGVEYDWFSPGAANPPARPNLPNPVSVYLNPTSGGPAELFSEIFSYDHANYALRKATIEAAIGHPMESYVVWLGHSVMSTGSLSSSVGITISGANNQLAGSMAASGNVGFSGLQNSVTGTVSAEDSVDLGSGNTVGAVQENSSSPQASTLLDENYLRNIAISYGTYSAGSLTLDNSNLGSAGVIFAEGDLTINADGLLGDWAFVSATGNITLAGDGHQVNSALGSVLAIAYLGDLSITATNTQVEGESHAPRGTIDVSGSGNTLVGPLSACQVMLSGTGNILSDGTVQAP